MILFVSHSGGRTGAPILLLELVRWLRANSKHDLRVLFREGGPLVESFSGLAETAVVQQSPVSTRRRQLLRKVLGQTGPAAKHGLPAAWSQASIDLVYSNTLTNGQLVSTLARPGVPVITHVHEMNYWIQQSGADNLQKVLGQTSRFIAASGAVKNNLTDNLGIPANLVDVVHEFISARTGQAEKSAGLREKFGIPADAFVIGGSGMESWRKGRDLFVQLAAGVRRLLPELNAHFLWVGSQGDAEDHLRLNHDARLTGVDKIVHWTGEVSDPHRYFAEFNLFAMVSREDPYPLVCLEAALLGKPIVCFADAGGTPELVEEDAGFVVPYLDLPAMARRVGELAGNPALAAKLGKRGSAKVLERHTVEKTAPKILEIIEREMCATR